MKRVAKALVAIIAMIIFIITFVIIGLRFFLPKINEYQSQLEGKLQSLTGIPFKIGHIEGNCVYFGTVLTFSDLKITTETLNIKVKKIKFSLDIWRSLFSLNLRFRDIIFYELNADYYKPIKFTNKDDFNHFYLTVLNNSFLKKFDSFALKESSITFLTPSMEKGTLKIHKLTWLNQDQYHRAQGFINLNNLQEERNQDGIQIKLNFRNKNGVINEGAVYLQANNINLFPWLTCWLRDNIGLENAVFSLSSWIKIENSRLKFGKLHLHHGEVNWKVDKQEHQLLIDNLLVTLFSQENGWFFNIPELQHLKTDQQQWLEGQISLLYLPQSKINQNNWRIRVNHIQLEGLRSILSMFSFFSPEFITDWQKRQPKGKLIKLALDITPQNLEKTVFDIIWKDLSWIRWKGLPSVTHFTGSLHGSQKEGIFSFNLSNSFIEYIPMFKELLEISTGKGIIFWSKENNSLQIWSKNIEIKSKSLWTTGDFRYLLPKNQPPTLSILVGAKLTDASDLWRYFPRTLMNKDLTDYLKKAIIGGHVDEATMIFHGNPFDFPFKKNNGQFQFFVPLRDATFKYQHNWPTIFDLNIDLNFERNGLLISSPSIKLGNTKALDLRAYIFDYNQSKLLIKSNIIGNGKDISNYFNQSPMKDSIGKLLNTVKIEGNIIGELMLDIPLRKNGENVIASGQIDLDNNDIDLTTINSKMKKVTGRFYFHNSDLKSEKLHAHWFGQPIILTFNTINNQNKYEINININGNWQTKKISIFPKSIIKHLGGSIEWKGYINIQLSSIIKDNPILSISLSSKLDKITSQIPTLNTKKVKQLGDIQILAIGDISQLKIYGSVGHQMRFNSQWKVSSKKIRLLKAAIYPYIKKNAVLPDNLIVMINLPQINNPKWISLLASLFSLNLIPKNYSKSFVIPDIVIITLPKINFANQEWNNIVFTINKYDELTKIFINSDNLKGSLSIPKEGNWKTKINYLYFNPKISSKKKNFLRKDNILQRYNISFWKDIDIYCSECWLFGYKLGKFKAQIIRNGQTLILKDGFLLNSSHNLKIFGIWSTDQKNTTTIRGELKGNRFDDLAAYYGIIIPIKKGEFKIDFCLNWETVPWKFDLKNLNGNLSFKLGNGGISQIGGGSSVQLLRFVSFDALLRKLKLDFSDTFSDDFLFDSIRGDATIKNGILNTNYFYLDGLIADIKIHGKINLIHRNINLEAIIFPEISTTVGIATAFLVNPITGAAVFAATRMLKPLWNKISLIRYLITGTLEKPKINEALPQFKKSQHYEK
ncbi:MAG: YhdP family protein [Arsenophonus sp.]